VTNPRVVGIGKPSKYFAFPVPSLGSEAAVTLNLASRDRPERRKNPRISVSTVVRKPNTYANADGATPKDTWDQQSKTWGIQGQQENQVLDQGERIFLSTLRLCHRKSRLIVLRREIRVLSIDTCNQTGEIDKMPRS
jgi:hypothetical protein